MKITVNVPARLTRDILTAAIESGIYGAFWLRNYDARLRADGNGLYIGKPIVGGDAETDTPAHAPYVGAKRIAGALALMLEGAESRSAQRAGRVLAGDFDASDADVVLQFATYGECVWG